MLAYGQGDVMAAGGWDCQPEAKGREWVCVSGNKKPAKPGEKDSGKTPETEPETGAEEAKTEPPLETMKPGRTQEPAKPGETTPPRPTEEPAQPGEAALPSSTEKSIQPSETALPSSTERPVLPREMAEEPARPSEPDRPLAATIKPEPEFHPVTPASREGEGAEAPSLNTGKKAEVPKAPVAEAPEKTVTPAQARAGWSCRTGAGKEWDCSLAGPDPRGEAHVVGASGEATPNWAQSGDMTREDEQRFSNIRAHMPADPWVLGCSTRKLEGTPGTDFFLMTDADRILREKSPLEIRSDRAELIHGESSNYQGSAEIVRADQKLYGDFVTHNKESGALNAQGNVIYREKGLAFASDTAFMKLNSNEGVLRNSQFILETVPARGTSRITHIDSKTQSRYETVTYTACPPGNQDWLLHGTSATIDKETGEGTAKNAWLEFKGVPFLYTPYMSFPVDDRRRSGLLSPYGGFSKQNGFDMTLPYYFNLAPNYDLTVAPRVMAKRGELLRGDFRYMTETSKGVLFADILPWDQIQEKTRGQAAWQNNSQFTEHWSSIVDLHLVSDFRYLYELGSLLSINNATNLRSWGSLNYNGGEFLGGAYSANMVVDYYQVLSPTLTKDSHPYYRMPQFNFNYGREVAGTGLQFQTNAEFVRFDQPTLVTGERLNLRPRLVYPFQDKAGYITPSLALQHTEYWLQNLGPGESSTFTRTAPIFSVDSGAYFEREFDLFGAPMQQTLEPRLFYLWVPKVGQPYNYNFGLRSDGTIGYRGLLFDSNEYDFNFYRLFRENRFAGIDRLSDANQVVPAVTTRFISQNSGLERLKLSVGKIFYIREPQVLLVPNGPYTTNLNDVVGEASSMLSQHWSFRGTGQWNPDNDRLDRLQVAIQYNNYANQLLNISYRYRRDPYFGSVPPLPVNPTIPRTVNQTDISTRLPLWAGWFGIGRWQYDLESQVTVQAMAGLEKETCCWRFSLVGLRYINGTTGVLATSNNASANNALYFQIELKGLGRFGDQIDNLLMKNFSGYRTDYDLPVAKP